jgi:hypothetical protein
MTIIHARQQWAGQPKNKNKGFTSIYRTKEREPQFPKRGFKLQMTLCNFAIYKKPPSSGGKFQ